MRAFIPHLHASIRHPDICIWRLFFTNYHLLAPFLKNWPLKQVFRGHFGPQIKFSGWNTAFWHLLQPITEQINCNMKSRIQNPGTKQSWWHHPRICPPIIYVRPNQNKRITLLFFKLHYWITQLWVRGLHSGSDCFLILFLKYMFIKTFVNVLMLSTGTLSTFSAHWWLIWLLGPLLNHSIHLLDTLLVYATF